jgi:hypothetical protein
LASSTLAAEPAFQFSKEIKAPPLKQEELLAVPLDSEVFAATRDGFPDLRLADAAGKPVPYLLRKVQTTRARPVRTTWPARQPAARPLESGGLEIVVELGEKDPHPNGLTLVSPLRNFEQRVRVYGSADGRAWEPIGEDTAIFDYSRYMDVRSVSVPFPETARRHFKIAIDDVTAEQQSELLSLTRRLRGAEETERTEQVMVDRRPFRIDRVDFWREVHEERATGDEKTTYPIAAHRVTQDSDKQQTIVHVDTQRQPVTSFELETPDRNFSRHAVIEAEIAQGVKKSWQRLGEATLSRVDFKNLKREELSISFPESRHAHYRIIIDNRDSPPLAVTEIKAEGDLYEALYLAAPGRQDQLLYGSLDADPPKYDTAAIEELLRSGFRPARAELGAEGTAKATGEPEKLKWAKLANNPVLYGGLIAILVILLAWGLYHAMKRVDKLPGE